MARLYDLTKRMTGIARKFGREVNRRRTKVSNLSRRVSNLKPSGKGRASKGNEGARDIGSNSYRTHGLHFPALCGRGADAVESEFGDGRAPSLRAAGARARVGTTVLTAINKIKHLVQTVDQEVGGSSPPSCTNEIKYLDENLLIFSNLHHAALHSPRERGAPVGGRAPGHGGTLGLPAAILTHAMTGSAYRVPKLAGRWGGSMSVRFAGYS